MPAKYGEASAKTSHDQPYVHMISYFITNIYSIINNIDENNVFIIVSLASY